MTTYGEYAERVRDAMKLLGVVAWDIADVRSLVRIALPGHATPMDHWAVAALIVPDCTVLGDVPLGRKMDPVIRARIMARGY